MLKLPVLPIRIQIPASFKHAHKYSTTSSSTCTARFPPNPKHLSQATTVKHLHFTGLTDYQLGSKIQNHILDQHLNFKLSTKSSRSIYSSYPTILTFEFQSVYTGGKRERDPKKATKIPTISDSNELTTATRRMTSMGVPYVQTDRGGQVTYHGPGQLVAYFIWDLRLWGNLTSRCFVNFIEQCSMNTVSSVGVSDVCKTENTGVWISKSGKEEKISSIGLNVKRYVTSHGISINLCPDLKYLNNPEFVMCGLDGFHQTSIDKELGGLPHGLNVEKLGDVLCQSVSDRMDNYMMNLPGKSDFKMNIFKKIIDLQKLSFNDICTEVDDFIHV